MLDRCIFKAAVALLTAALAVLILGGALPAQEPAGDAYLGCGLARVAGGDVSEARDRALQDAQAKVVLQALSAQLTVADMAQRFSELQNLFLARPEVYLQSFKVIREHAQADLYQISIQGIIQQEQLRHDLESMGILKPEAEKLRVLVMLAEKDFDHTEPVFWWAGSRRAAGSRFGMQPSLERKLAEQGLQVVNPPGAAGAAMPAEISQTAEPDIEKGSRFAVQFGASLLVMGSAELTRGIEQPKAVIKNIQCSLRVQLIDVSRQNTVAQVTTSALGASIDEEAAAADAVGKACGQAARQMLDRLYQQSTTKPQTGP
jgi:hypothetical protein